MADKKQEEPKEKSKKDEAKIYGLRTTANREDQVMDFVSSNADKKKYKVFSLIRPHGMRGYIFMEAASRMRISGFLRIALAIAILCR